MVKGVGALILVPSIGRYQQAHAVPMIAPIMGLETLRHELPNVGSGLLRQTQSF